MSFFQILNLQADIARLMTETQTVMGLRVMGMTGILPAKPDENMRMMSEKLPAMLKSADAAHKAAQSGQRPDQIVAAALEPLSRKVTANRKRLMK